MLADQFVKAVSTLRCPIAVCFDDEASGGCVDTGSEDSGRMRRIEQGKSKQDREQKLHPIQCSATSCVKLGIDSGNTNGELVKNPLHSLTINE